MKKFISTIASFFTLTAVACCALVGFSAPKKALFANADSPQTPVQSTAVTKDCAAVANGNVLYVYHAQSGDVWQEYAHTSPISELHFDNAGNLYFLDEQTNPKLYKLSVGELADGAKATDTGVDCDTFAIFGETLYYADVTLRGTSLYYAPLTDITTPTGSRSFSKSLSHFSHGEEAFYALGWGEDTLYRLSIEGSAATEVATLPTGTTAVTVLADKVFGTTQSGVFYGYSLAELSERASAEKCTPLVTQTGGYRALSAYNGDVYLLNGKEAYAYVAADGSFQKATGAFALPTAKTIPTAGITAEIFSENSATVTLAQAKVGALLIEVDLEGAKTSEHFPFLHASRATQALTAVKLAQTERYTLLIRRERAESEYTSYLVPTQSVRTLDGEFTPDYATPITGYTSNAVGLYKYPVLSDGGLTMPTRTTLPRNAEIRIVGEVKGLDCEYYAVTYGEYTGYLPKAYVVPFDGSPLETEATTIGDKQKNKDAVWRMAYILLGAGAICILADFLLMRKKRDD